jgi:hypothetical protein
MRHNHVFAHARACELSAHSRFLIGDVVVAQVRSVLVTKSSPPREWVG